MTLCLRVHAITCFDLGSLFFNFPVYIALVFSETVFAPETFSFILNVISKYIVCFVCLLQIKAVFKLNGRISWRTWVKCLLCISVLSYNARLRICLNYMLAKMQSVNLVSTFLQDVGEWHLFVADFWLALFLNQFSHNICNQRKKYVNFTKEILRFISEMKSWIPYQTQYEWYRCSYTGTFLNISSILYNISFKKCMQMFWKKEPSACQAKGYFIEENYINAFDLTRKMAKKTSVRVLWMWNTLCISSWNDILLQKYSITSLWLYIYVPYPRKANKYSLAVNFFPGIHQYVQRVSLRWPVAEINNIKLLLF